MENLIVILLLALVIRLAIRAVIKAKKSGSPCGGCPHSGSCSGHCEKKEQ